MNLSNLDIRTKEFNVKLKPVYYQVNKILNSSLHWRRSKSLDDKTDRVNKFLEQIYSSNGYDLMKNASISDMHLSSDGLLADKPGEQGDIGKLKA